MIKMKLTVLIYVKLVYILFRCMKEKLLEIEHPITGTKLEVVNQDFRIEMSWIDA